MKKDILLPHELALIRMAIDKQTGKVLPDETVPFNPIPLSLFQRIFGVQFRFPYFCDWIEVQPNMESVLGPYIPIGFDFKNRIYQLTITSYVKKKYAVQESLVLGITRYKKCTNVADLFLEENTLPKLHRIKRNFKDFMRKPLPQSLRLDSLAVEILGFESLIFDFALNACFLERWFNVSTEHTANG